MKKVTLKSVLSRGNFTGNIDTLKTFGTYLVMIGSSGLPDGVTGGILMVFEPGGSINRVVQLLETNQATVGNKTYSRKIISEGAWTEWREI